MSVHGDITFHDIVLFFCLGLLRRDDVAVLFAGLLFSKTDTAMANIDSRKHLAFNYTEKSGKL